jgi:hypothetical protein
MRLSEAQIIKYQDIYFAKFGIKIARDDALKQGLALLRLVKNIRTNHEKEKKDETTRSDSITKRANR